MVKTETYILTKSLTPILLWYVMLCNANQIPNLHQDPTPHSSPHTKETPLIDRRQKNGPFLSFAAHHNIMVSIKCLTNEKDYSTRLNPPSQSPTQSMMIDPQSEQKLLRLPP